MKLPTLLILCSGIASVHAWGTVGHQAVAYIASNFVTAQTKAYCQNILGDTSVDYLASVALWADTYRSTTAGKFSSPFHYIDAQDNPPTSCSVDYNRDCTSGGCVVSAIQNYTNIVLATQDFDALKFLIHFLGDIHQPLHDENLARGGNSIAVTFDGVSTNLHSIWDTNMITKLTGGTSLATAQTWASSLTTEIKSGDFSSQSASWLDGISVNDPVSSSMVWAKQTNQYVCSTVLAGGVQNVESMDLAGTYYQTTVPVIKIQIARAGYRLAAWLNLIATGSISL